MSLMFRGVLAVALTVLFVASALFVLAPAQTHTATSAATMSSHTTESTHPAAMTVTILNGYDYQATDFYPGETGWGTLYFSVTDIFDLGVNVTIIDPNATRDGVPSPAFHYHAILNSTTSTFNSYRAGVGYAFPATLPYGGGWTVNLSAPGGGSVVTNVTTLVYYAELSSSIGYGATLPGRPMSLFWSLYSEANGAALYTHATNVLDHGTVRRERRVPELLPAGPSGSNTRQRGTGPVERDRSAQCDSRLSDFLRDLCHHQRER